MRAQGLVDAAAEAVAGQRDVTPETWKQAQVEKETCLCMFRSFDAAVRAASSQRSCHYVLLLVRLERSELLIVKFFHTLLSLVIA
jgi:hypothetical protein